MTVAPSPSDPVLVARLRDRDRDAWADVYRLYGDPLYRFAYSLTGNQHDAADLVQETFVRALPRLDALDAETVNLRAYLFATERNLFLKGIERAKRQEPVADVPEPAERGPIEDDPERATLLGQQQSGVRDAAAGLAPRQRLVLALRELEGRSYAEIGELVGLNENAVAQLISRARQSLRAELRLIEVDRSKLPAECQSFLPLLSAHLDGQLKGAASGRVLAHLETCEHCQAALADMREASRLYRSLLPIPVMELFERVDDALAATGYWTTRARARRGLRASRKAWIAAAIGLGGLAAAVAVGAAVVGGDGQALSSARRPDNRQTSQAASTTVRAPTSGGAADTTPPRLALPGTLITQEATTPDGAPVTFAVSATDDVDGPLTADCSAEPGDVLPLGTTEVVCTSSDAAGNKAKASFRVAVVDTTAPALDTPASVSKEAEGPAGAVVRFAPRAEDRAHPNVAARCVPRAGTTFPVGTTRVTCRARDASANEAVRSFTVAVRDTTPPVLTLPDETRVEAGMGLEYEASARDAVEGSVAHRCSIRGGAVLRVGRTAVVCTSRDSRGNTARRRFMVQVVDTTPPRLTLPADRRVEALGPDGAHVDYPASARDRADGAVATRCSPVSGSRFRLGTTAVRCTARDTHGNGASGTFRVVVVDTTPPALELPGALTVEATRAAGSAVPFRASAADGVDGSLQAVCAPAPGEIFPLGRTTVDCSARDAHGNAAHASFRVTVVDTTPPVLMLPPNRSVTATSAAGVAVTYTTSALDAVDGPVTPRCSRASGAVFPVGTTTVSCTATDAHANARSDSFSVTVAPVPRPDLTVAVTPTRFTITNAGNAASGAFTVTVQGVGTFTFASLAPAASASRTVSCASVQRQVTVDPANQVVESNEQNNGAKLPAC